MSDKTKEPGSLAQVLGAVGQKARVPVIQIVRQKQLASAVSKAVAPDIRVNHTADGTRTIQTPQQQILQQISNRTADNISQADTTLQMIPDTELGAQILISAMSCPKDMMTLELMYSVTAGLLPPAIVSSLTNVLKKNFEDVYKIKTKLPRILREVLFDKGSHVVAVIPENSIDELINRGSSISLEAYSQAIAKECGFAGKVKHGLATGVGTLGPGVAGGTNNRTSVADSVFNYAAESISLDAYKPHTISHDQRLCLAFSTIDGSSKESQFIEDVLITDNPNILRGPELEKSLRAATMRDRLAYNRVAASLESYGQKAGIKLDDRSLMAAIYKGRKTSVKQVQVMKTDNQLERSAIGRPLVMELPPESVIPVFTPGQEDKHVGYFILLDQTGNPVKTSTENDALTSMTRRLNNATNQQQNIVSRLKQLTDGFGCGNDQEHTDMMVRIYADMVEADLLARLRNGIYANSVALAKNPDYYRVMLTRVLAQQKTTVLFMPVEMIVYFARRYNKWGVGVSILDDMKVLNNIRAITTLANTMLGIRNSIPQTKVDLNLDETDPDPYKTAEMFIAEMMRVNQTAIPLGASSPTDMLDFFQKQRYQFNLKGHPGIPEVSAEFTESNTNYSRVDTDLEKSLQERAMMTMGLNTEIVSNGFNGSETATSVVANNLMLSRRVAVLQEQINPHITDYHRKIIRADEDLLQELREVLESNYDTLNVDEETVRKELGIDQAVELRGLVVNQLLMEFIDKLDVSLPRPETASLKSQKEALDEFTNLLDPALDAYLSDEFFTEEVGGTVSKSVASLRKILRAYFVRKYMAENGILPELSSIVTNTDEEEYLDLWEAQKDHIEKLTKSLGNFMRKIHKVKKEESQSYENMENDMSDTGSDGSSFGSDSSSSDTESSTDTDLGELGFGDDDSLSDPLAGGDDAAAAGGENTNPDEQPPEDPAA